MPINTSGYGVNVMPQYSPSNPSLVAFNPSAMADGVSTTFQLAQMLEKIKAQRALQAELEATRAGRIAATNVGSNVAVAEGGRTLANMPTVMQVDQLKLANDVRNLPAVGDLAAIKMREEAKALPVLTDASISGANMTIEKDKLLAKELPDIVSAQGQTARATSANAQTAINTAALRESTERAQMSLATQQAMLDRVNAPYEARLKAIRLAKSIKNADTDEARANALADADVELKKSMAIENLSQARYLDAGGGRAPAKEQTPIQRAKDLQDLIKELDTMKVGDGVRTIGSYIADTFNEDGSVKGDKFWGMQGNQTRDPVGDFYIEQRQMYQKELLGLRDRIRRDAPANGSLDPDNAPKGTPRQSQSRTQSVGEAQRWLRDNPNDPRAPAVRKKLQEDMSNL